jgi:hypothetical protein
LLLKSILNEAHPFMLVLRHDFFCPQNDYILLSCKRLLLLMSRYNWHASSVSPALRIFATLRNGLVYFFLVGRIKKVNKFSFICTPATKPEAKRMGYAVRQHLQALKRAKPH